MQLRRLLRAAGALLLLGATLYFASPEKVFAQLTHADPRWLALGLALSLPLYLLSALRWYLVARRIGAPMSYKRCLADYYLGNLANQALPTGLAGAALRAYRHGRRQAADGQVYGLAKGVAGVVIERISGLISLGGFALVGAFFLASEDLRLSAWGVLAVAAVTLAAAIAFRVARRGQRGRDFVDDARHALWETPSRYQLFAVSSLLVLVLGATFYCAAEAISVEISFSRALFVTPLILASMVIPLAIAGWGVREAASAALFAALGLGPDTGVAVSVSFGLLSLVASAPGLMVLLLPDPSLASPRSAAPEHH